MLDDKEVYIPGEFNIYCMSCNRKYKASEIRRRWDGLLVCPDDWEIRHPQDFVRGVQEKSNILPYSFDVDGSQTAISGTACTLSNSRGISGIGVSGCMIAGNITLGGATNVASSGGGDPGGFNPYIPVNNPVSKLTVAPVAISYGSASPSTDPYTLSSGVVSGLGALGQLGSVLQLTIVSITTPILSTILPPTLIDVTLGLPFKYVGNIQGMAGTSNHATFFYTTVLTVAQSQTAREINTIVTQCTGGTFATSGYYLYATTSGGLASTIVARPLAGNMYFNVAQNAQYTTVCNLQDYNEFVFTVEHQWDGVSSTANYSPTGPSPWGPNQYTLNGQNYGTAVIPNPSAFIFNWIKTGVTTTTCTAAALAFTNY